MINYINVINYHQRLSAAHVIDDDVSDADVMNSRRIPNSQRYTTQTWTVVRDTVRFLSSTLVFSAVVCARRRKCAVDTTPKTLNDARTGADVNKGGIVSLAYTCWGCGLCKNMLTSTCSRYSDGRASRVVIAPPDAACILARVTLYVTNVLSRKEGHSVYNKRGPRCLD